MVDYSETLEEKGITGGTHEIYYDFEPFTEAILI